jgi:DNA (cytosine-5)-methyltransferase 1
MKDPATTAVACNLDVQPGSIHRMVSQPELVLSLFPGIGLLDRSFEDEGFCVVRGPDVLWGGDVKRFNPPSGRFDGVIGGPPCKWWSSAANIAKARGQHVQPDLIPEFVRCVAEAQPTWWLMENIRRAPIPVVPGYQTHAILLDASNLGADQKRVRRFTFGTRDGRKLRVELLALAPYPKHGTVTTRNLRWDALRKRPRSTNSLRTWSDAAAAQGLPPEFLAQSPFTQEGRWEMLGNGVPLPMGRAIAKAVRMANCDSATSGSYNSKPK